MFCAVAMLLHVTRSLRVIGMADRKYLSTELQLNNESKIPKVPSASLQFDVCIVGSDQNSRDFLMIETSDFHVFFKQRPHDPGLLYSYPSII